MITAAPFADCLAEDQQAAGQAKGQAKGQHRAHSKLKIAVRVYSSLE